MKRGHAYADEEEDEGEASLFNGLPSSGAAPMSQSSPEVAPGAGPADVMALRLWMSNMHAGTVIGKGGGSVKQMREQSGCKVQIAEQVAGEMERLVSITGAASQVTHASELLVDVLEEAARDAAARDAAQQQSGAYDEAAPTEPPSHALKLLLSNNQVGGIIGKKGSTIMQMREESGAMIKVEAAATLTNERVVLVNGVRQAVLAALALIIGKLAQMPKEEAPPPHQRQRTGPGAAAHGGMGASYGMQPWACQPGPNSGLPPPGYPGSYGTPSYGNAFGSQYAAGASGGQPGYGQQAAGRAGTAPGAAGYGSYGQQYGQAGAGPYAGQQGYAQSYAQAQGQGFGQAQQFGQQQYGQAQQYGGLPAGAAVAAGGGSVEQLVPVQLVGRLIGRGGAGIKELREASGATIKIESECVPGTDQRRLIISGTPQQTQVAHSLVQTRLAMGP